MRGKYEEKISEVIKFAQNNENTISYNVVVDILKEKTEGVTETDITSVMLELNKYGISITPEKDEGYTAEETDPANFIPAEVNIGQRPVNIYNLMERLENREIDLNPGFQRKGNLWSLTQQSRLIESLMLKIPIPAFYFNAADEDNWIVIDGLQRLTAFQNFLVGTNDEESGNKMKKKLENLQYLTDFNGHTFDELPRQYMRRIKETPVIAYTVEKGAPDEIVYNIFQRINTGGIVLNDQEIRQALYQGKVTDLIEELARTNEFLIVTEHSIRTERMLDREYVTRFLAFTELDHTKEYNGNIDSYLIKAMKLVNTYPEEDIDRIKKSFRRIMNYCYQIFGRYAFRKYSRMGRRGPINKALFEIWSFCFSKLSDENLEKLIMIKGDFLKKFEELQNDPAFIKYLKSGDQYSTKYRITMAQDLIKEILCYEKFM